MKKIVYIFFLCICFNLKAQPPTMWYNKFGGFGVDIGYGIKESYARQYIVVGSTSSFGAGGNDAYLILIDSMGQKVWEKTYGGALTDIGKSILVNPIDSGFIFTGYTSSFGNGGYDVYVVRTKKDGTLVWQNSFGGLDWDFGNEIVLAPDGNVIICGSTYSKGYGKKDGYLLKVNASSGALMWDKCYGGAEDDDLRSLRIAGSNSVILTGQSKSYADIKGDIYFLKTNLNGDSLTSRCYGYVNKEDFGNSIIVDAYQNGFVIAGGSDSYSSWGKDAFIFGITQTADSLWLEHYGNANYDQIAVDVVNTNAFTTGSYLLAYSDLDFAIFKKDPKNLLLTGIGVYLSGDSFGGFEDEEVNDIKLTSDKGYIGVGYTRSYGAADQDVYVIKYDSTSDYGGNLIGLKEGLVEKNGDFTLFPSIATDDDCILRIKTKQNINSVSVYDSFGIQCANYNAINDSDFRLDICNFKPGLYIVKVGFEASHRQIKVLKR